VSDMTSEQMKEELERLRVENEALKKRSEKGLSLKVSQKGGVSVYGLGRFLCQWRLKPTQSKHWWPATDLPSSYYTLGTSNTYKSEVRPGG